MSRQPWYRLPEKRPGHCVVIGGGIAGCSIAYALNRLDIPVTLIEQSTIGSGTSANPRAVLRPHLIRHAGPMNQFNETAFNHTVDLLATLNAIHPIEYDLSGVIHLIDNCEDWPALETTYPVNADTARQLANIDLPSGALFTPSGGWVNIHSYCQALINNCAETCVHTDSRVTQLHSHTDKSRGVSWQVEFTHKQSDKSQRIAAENVIIANGIAMRQFSQTRDLPLTISAGQTTKCKLEGCAPKKVITGKRYLIADETHCTVGATHHRMEPNNHVSNRDRASEDADNLRTIVTQLPALAGRLQTHDNWQGFRSATPDRLPLVGAAPDIDWYTRHYAALRHGPTHKQWPSAEYHPGLYLLCGLGSRGLATSALAARLVAGIINGHQDETEKEFSQLLHPARFIIRTLQRQAATSGNRPR